MDVFVDHVQISIKLNTILFPIDANGLLQDLDSLDFRPVKKDEMTLDGLPSKTGDIAIKNNTFLNINNQAQVISITSSRVKEIEAIFMELTSPLEKNGLNFKEDVRAYSIGGDFVVETKNNAFEKLRNFLNINEASKSIDDIFGTDSQLLALVLVPKNKPVRSEEFYHIKIEPYVQRLGKVYHVEYTERKLDQREILRTLIELPTKVEKAIQKIES